MAIGNTVEVVGNLTRDVELRFTSQGRAAAKFGLAYNHRFNRNGQWEETTSFFDVVAYGQLGENVAESLRSGMRVTVSGRLEQNRWETSDGEKRSRVEIVADEVSPSLKWATLDGVTPNPRKERYDDDRSGGGNGSTQRSSSTRSSSGGGRVTPLRPPEPDYSDEEPF